VPIGETLAHARQQAGLTMAQVSKRTRIRETIIRSIEHDDYAECGGDFYARGHIRAIARAVGADPEPLIQEYDTQHREAGPIGTVSLDELLAASGRTGPRHPPELPAVRARAASAAGSGRRKVIPARAGDRVAPGAAARRRPVNWAVLVGVALAVVVLAFVALHVLAGPPPGRAPSAAAKPAVTGHGGAGPAVKASRGASGPSPVPKASQTVAQPPAPARPLAPVQAAAFGPNGGDNPQLAHLVLGGGHRGGWHSDWYSSARFGNLYRGTGLLLKMGHAVTVTDARIDLGSTTGASFQLRVGGAPTMAGMRPVAHVSGAGGVVRLHLTSPAHGRYVLIWFTKLPTDSSGAFQAHVYAVALQGRP
jgi:transcriptional regulator with XRE-family HTH domain